MTNKIILSSVICMIFALSPLGIDSTSAWNKNHAVVIQIDSNNTLSVTWQAPPSAASECPVKRYRLRIRQDGIKQGKTWKMDGDSTYFKLNDVRNNTDYRIRLNAITCDGTRVRTRWITFSASSSLINAVWFEQRRSNTEDADEDDDSEENLDEIPGKPTDPRTRTSSSSVTLTWQPPVAGGVVQGYKVGYSEGVPDLTWRYVDANQRSIVIDGLKASTQYVISLCAFNKIGEGQVLYDLIYTRDEAQKASDDNFGPPVNLRAKILSSTSAWLQWTDPTLGSSTQILDNRYYNVLYKALPNGKSLSVIVKALHVVLYDLVPGTNYEFKVRTMKDQQYSSFSLAATNRTSEAAPSSPPRQIQVHFNNGSLAYEVSWRPPRQPNGDITSYFLLVTTDQRLPEKSWTVHSVNVDKTSETLSNLLPDTTYYFKIKAANSKGTSQFSDVVAYHTQNHQNGNRSNFVYPVDPEVNGGMAEPPESQTNAFPRAEKLSAPSATDFLIQMQNDDSRFLQEAKKEVFGTARKEPTKVTGKSGHAMQAKHMTYQTLIMHSATAVLKWDVGCDKPQSDGYHVVGVSAKDNPNNYYEKTSNSNFVAFENLKPNTHYIFKVKRVTNTEEMEWSDEGSFTTTLAGN